jgi:multidrug transporter EmrE-like cation transporter
MYLLDSHDRFEISGSVMTLKKRYYTNIRIGTIQVDLTKLNDIKDIYWPPANTNTPTETLPYLLEFTDGQRLAVSATPMEISELRQFVGDGKVASDDKPSISWRQFTKEEAEVVLNRRLKLAKQDRNQHIWIVATVAFFLAAIAFSQAGQGNIHSETAWTLVGFVALIAAGWIFKVTRNKVDLASMLRDEEVEIWSAINGNKAASAA